jgi:hypothetical protein
MIGVKNIELYAGFKDTNLSLCQNALKKVITKKNMLNWDLHQKWLVFLE